MAATITFVIGVRRMSEKQTYEAALAPVRHFADEALRELEALATDWSERQRKRVAAGDA